MRKIMVAVLFLCCFGHLSAEESLPRISLQAPLYEEGNSQLATISHTVFDTAGLILSMLGQYDLLLDRESRTEDPAAYCLENDVDRFISGSCTINEEGGYEISLSVYDRDAALITAQRRETADTALDVFDAVDNLVIPLLEELSGRQIAFGTIALDNRGVEGRYRFFLDGVEYPPEEDLLERILFGTHMVRIEQERMDGRYVAEHKTVEVLEDGITSFLFTIPGILGREERNLRVHEDIIEKYWNNRLKAKTVDQAFGELLLMLEDVSYSSDMAGRKDSILARLEEWEAYKHERRHGDPRENRKGRMILSLGLDLTRDGLFDSDSWAEYEQDETVSFNEEGTFVLPQAEIQYFIQDHHALIARFGIVGGDGEVNPETVANSEGDPYVMGTSSGGVELTLGYEYYFKHLFVGGNMSWRAMDVSWEAAGEDVDLPDNDVFFLFNLEPKVGVLLNQNGNWVYKFFISTGASLLVMDGEDTKARFLNGIRIGISAGYGGFRF